MRSASRRGCGSHRRTERGKKDNSAGGVAGFLLSPLVAALSLRNSGDQEFAKARELSRLMAKEQRRLVRSLHSDLPELHRSCNLIPRTRRRSGKAENPPIAHAETACPYPQNSIFAIIFSAVPQSSKVAGFANFFITSWKFFSILLSLLFHGTRIQCRRSFTTESDLG